ncbi:hypothetical protein EJD97_008597 [Solanum chilense]|uniref:Uncharacterized protein n=1 Tax=Solanum chilense TaxID=4083 RepID=A0A6N2AIX8_SOLCI|nr:hypothetical protein EJD97_008597 [Solanum chilense]
MAYSPNSKTLHYFSSWKFICLILTLCLVLNHGHGTTCPPSPSRMPRRLKEEASRMFSELSDEKKEFLNSTSNRFHMLPKGIPIPPSAPSKRCN